jgi:hypothetical protein
MTKKKGSRGGIAFVIPWQMGDNINACHLSADLTAATHLSIAAAHCYEYHFLSPENQLLSAMSGCQSVC